MLCVLPIAFVLLIENVSCANILVTVDIPSPSHIIWMRELAKGLAVKGRNVTLLSTETVPEKPHKNYHTIKLEGMDEEGDGAIDEVIYASTWRSMWIFYEYNLYACNITYYSAGLKKLLEYPDDFRFDALVFDITLAGCLLPVVERFHYPPTIGVTPFLFPHYLALDFGNPIQHSYIPGYMVSYSEDMNFVQRLTNYFWNNVDLLLRNYYLKPELQKLAVKRFGDGVDDFTNLQRHISLLLANIDNTYNYPQPLAPNIIPVGGLHLQRAGQLPQDLKEIMDNARNGVILFSLGTNVRSDKLKPNVKSAILQALSKLDLTIIWKFESNLTSVPPNVIIRQWLPQTAILAHPNTRLFISHGGALSAMEAAYYGVPVVGIPFYVDQFSNIMLMQAKGIGLKLDFFSITAYGMYNAIKQVLDNPMYARNMKDMSKRLRDQEQTPLERAVFWIEYAIKHNGTHFLNARSRDLHIFVSSCTDIHLFLLVTAFIILTIPVLSYKHYSASHTKKEKKKTQ